MRDKEWVGSNSYATSIMSSQRQPHTQQQPLDGMPPPPPYQPVAPQQAQTLYTPPPGPPPGHAGPIPNMLNADPASYIPPTHASTGRQDSVSSGAQQMGQGSNRAQNPFTTQRQPSIKENQLEFLRSYDTIFLGKCLLQ